MDLSFKSDTFSKSLKYFFIFLAWPSVNILGLSITFFLILTIIQSLSKRYGDLFSLGKFESKALVFFGISAIISTLIGPEVDREIDIEFFQFKVIIQQVFWILIAIFFANAFKKLNFYDVSKFILLGLVLLNLNFFLFNVGSIPPFRFSISRNSYVFTMIALVPFGLYYFTKQSNKRLIIIYLLCCVFLVLLSNGRAGAILILLEGLILYGLTNPIFIKYFKNLVLFFVVFNLLSNTLIDFEPIRESFSKQVEGISPRFAELISGEGQAGDLEKDRSWLIRELMIEKGFEIFEDYPWFGIGTFNFMNYDARLDALYSVDKFSIYLYGQQKGADEYNNTSPHNSYLQLLSENGLIGTILYLSAVFYVLTNIVIKIIRGNLSFDDIPQISFLFLSIYFYVIASLMGTLTYFIIGSAISNLYEKKNKRLMLLNESVM